jgi:hypothetical protein
MTRSKITIIDEDRAPRVIIRTPAGETIYVSARLNGDWPAKGGPVHLVVNAGDAGGGRAPEAYVPLPDGRSIPVAGAFDVKAGLALEDQVRVLAMTAALCQVGAPFGATRNLFEAADGYLEVIRAYTENGEQLERLRAAYLESLRSGALRSRTDGEETPNRV